MLRWRTRRSRVTGSYDGGVRSETLYVAHDTGSVGASYWPHARCKPRSVM